MKNKICKISLFSAILASISSLPADAVIRTNNSSRSYADAYNQVNAMRYQQEYAAATTASATESLPVSVSDEELAKAILNNTSETTVAHLENCAMIYPNGVFRWEAPESGNRLDKLPQCVAVVSLVDANTNAVLATTTVAAGDTMKCNIDSFPESGMNAVALSKTELPADAKPTLEDVEKVMNEEQKQNAGFKIAAGAILAGVAGNILAPKEAGNTKMFGTGKTQLVDTAIGAAAGAGIMAASSYSGKVAGDTIKSTAVNAASGMIVGNMLAGSSSDGGIVVVKKCNIEKDIAAYSGEKGGETFSYPAISKGEHDCVVGNIEVKGDVLESFNTEENEKKLLLLVNKNGSAKKCTQNTINPDFYDCKDINLAKSSIYLQNQSNPSEQPAFTDIFGKTVKDTELPELKRFVPDTTNPSQFKESEYTGVVEDSAYFVVSQARESEKQQHAYVVFEKKIPFEKETKLDLKLGGHETSELTKILGTDSSFVYVKRNSDGSIGDQITDESKENLEFTPTSGNASDGGLVDMSNQARTKGTLVGTAAGGALGGFAGYQGAKSEITERWTAAVIEYEDSLSNFVCMTGNRYLSKYNDFVEIPSLKEPE